MRDGVSLAIGMANLAAKAADYNGPDVETRLGGPRGPVLGTGRPKREWIRRRLNRYGKDGGAADTELEQIIDHQIEVAKSWEVRIVGRGSDGEPIRVASGRDSTEAAKFLCGLVGLGPEDIAKFQLVVAEHLRSVARDQVDIGRTLLGKKLEAMTEKEIAEFWRLCDFGVARYLQAAMERVAGEGGPMPPDAAQISASPPAEEKQVLGTPCPTVAAEPNASSEAGTISSDQPQDAPTEESTDGDS